MLNKSLYKIKNSFNLLLIKLCLTSYTLLILSFLLSLLLDELFFYHPRSWFINSSLAFLLLPLLTLVKANSLKNFFWCCLIIVFHFFVWHSFSFINMLFGCDNAVISQHLISPSHLKTLITYDKTCGITGDHLYDTIIYHKNSYLPHGIISCENCDPKFEKWSNENTVILKRQNDKTCHLDINQPAKYSLEALCK